MNTHTPKALAMIASALASSASLAGPGDVAWSIERDGYSTTARPTVGADGALYWSFRGLYKLDPTTGSTLWFRDDQAGGLISIGPDGTIYATGSVDQGLPGQPSWHPTAIALSPQNDLLWQWNYDPAYGYPEAGPTLGPDGNLYVIAYGGYESAGHLFSLTTSGQFRWDFRHFANGNGAQRLQFAGGNVLKVGDLTAIPTGPLVPSSAGMVAADLASGQLAWSEPFAANGDPVVSPDGEHFSVAQKLTRQFRSYASPHSLEWTYMPDWSPTGINTIAIGPEGNTYISHAAYKVVSLSPSGSVRWSIANALPASYYYPPTVSPDGNVIIYTTTGPGATPGYVTALRTSDGSKLWEKMLPGPVGGYSTIRGYGGVQFSPDSAVAYIPASSVCYCGPNGYEQRGYLFAMEVGAAAASCYADCDGIGGLTGNDFQCFLDKYLSGDAYANCDGVGGLTGNDFQCFLNRYIAGCP